MSIIINYSGILAELQWHYYRHPDIIADYFGILNIMAFIKLWNSLLASLPRQFYYHGISSNYGIHCWRLCHVNSMAFIILLGHHWIIVNQLWYSQHSAILANNCYKLYS